MAVIKVACTGKQFLSCYIEGEQIRKQDFTHSHFNEALTKAEEKSQEQKILFS